MTEYTYDIAHRMLTIEDARNVVYLENEYDVNGRVEKQTRADGGQYEFSYTLNGSGQVTQTDVTNPRGYTRRVTFNGDRFMTSDTRALSEAIERATTYTRLSGSNLVETETDELARVTRYTYDIKGNVASVTHLYGTADAVTTSFTYDPTFNLVTSTTDPLSHTISTSYDSQGRLQSTTDALSHQTVFGTNAAGQIVSATDPLSKTTEFTYDSGDPLGFCGGDVNVFAYVENSPLMATDPTGLCPICPIAVPLAGAVARAAAAAALAALTQMANAEVGNRLNDRRRSQRDCYRRLEEDWERCRAESDPATRAECWKQSMERYSACRRGVEIPPLFPWEPWK